MQPGWMLCVDSKTHNIPLDQKHSTGQRLHLLRDGCQIQKKHNIYLAKNVLEIVRTIVVWRELRFPAILEAMEYGDGYKFMDS